MVESLSDEQITRIARLIADELRDRLIVPSLMSLPQVAAYTGASQSAIYKLRGMGRFPAPVHYPGMASTAGETDWGTGSRFGFLS